MILFPFVGNSIGGSHRSILGLAKQLRVHKVEYAFVIHEESGPLYKFLSEFREPIISLPHKNLAGTHPTFFGFFKDFFSSFFVISRFLRNNDITLVHGNDWRINLSWAAPCKVSSIPYVWHQRSVVSNSKKWRLINLVSRHVISISEFVDRSLPSNIDSSKRSIIKNPFDTKRLPRFSRTNVDSLSLCYMGRIIRRKNLEVVLLALEIWTRNYRHSNTQLCFNIYGAGDADYISELKLLAAELCIDHIVHFKGFVQNPSETLLLEDILVAPGRAEGFGRTLVEGMAAGCLVIASDEGGHREVIDNGSTGYLFSSQNHAQLESILEQVSVDRSLLVRIQREGNAFARGNFGLEAHYKAVTDVYHRLEKGI